MMTMMIVVVVGPYNTYQRLNSHIIHDLLTCNQSNRVHLHRRHYAYAYAMTDKNNSIYTSVKRHAELQ